MVENKDNSVKDKPYLPLSFNYDDDEDKFLELGYKLIKRFPNESSFCKATITIIKQALKVFRTDFRYDKVHLNNEQLLTSSSICEHMKLCFEQFYSLEYPFSLILSDRTIRKALTNIEECDRDTILLIVLLLISTPKNEQSETSLLTLDLLSKTGWYSPVASEWGLFFKADDNNLLQHFDTFYSTEEVGDKDKNIVFWQIENAIEEHYKIIREISCFFIKAENKWRLKSRFGFLNVADHQKLMVTVPKVESLPSTIYNCLAFEPENLDQNKDKIKNIIFIKHESMLSFGDISVASTQESSLAKLTLTFHQTNFEKLTKYLRLTGNTDCVNMSDENMPYGIIKLRRGRSLPRNERIFDMYTQEEMDQMAQQAIDAVTLHNRDDQALELVSQGANINYQDPKTGYTIVHFYAHQQVIEWVDRVIERSEQEFDYTLRDRNGRLISELAENKKTEILLRRREIEAGVDVEPLYSPRPIGDVMAQAAVKRLQDNPDIEIACQWVKRGANINYRTKGSKYTILHSIVETCSIEDMKTVIAGSQQNYEFPLPHENDEIIVAERQRRADLQNRQSKKRYSGVGRNTRNAFDSIEDQIAQVAINDLRIERTDSPMGIEMDRVCDWVKTGLNINYQSVGFQETLVGVIARQGSIEDIDRIIQESGQVYDYSLRDENGKLLSEIALNQDTAQALKNREEAMGVYPVSNPSDEPYLGM